MKSYKSNYNQALIEQLIYKYQLAPKTLKRDQFLNYLIDSKVQIKHYSVIILEKNFFDQSFRNK